jgi:tetratricopeptide (TPR) repeat protein
MGDTDAALAEYAQALKVQEEHGDVFGQVEAHKRLASLMDDLGRSDEAEDHRSRSAALRRELGDTD